jgi:integrase
MRGIDEGQSLDAPRVKVQESSRKPRGAHPAQRLTAVKVKALRIPGRYADGNNLYLIVDERGTKRWMWRGVVRGKRCDLGLGSAVVVTLAEARSEALRLRIAAKRGEDLLAGRRAARAPVPTFREAAKIVHAQHSAAFRNDKHRAAWLSTLDTYVFPHFGDRRVDQVTRADVLAALSGFWTRRPETARRVKQRIRIVLEWARAAGHRSGDNPVDGLKRVLPRHSTAQEHHAAMAYTELPAFLTSVREAPWAAAAVRLALEWTILTCVRTSEALGAKWGEIDREGRVWTIPGERMKAGRSHRVPLSPRSLELLDRAGAIAEEGGYVFPGRQARKPLSNMALAMLMRRLGRSETVHGMRSAFRDWASEQTNAPHAVCEAALAHVISNSVEAAYARSDLFDRRRELMEAWATFLSKAE